MDEIKPGTKTTEFWVSICPVVIGLMQADSPNSQYLIIGGMTLGCLYIISRCLIKLKSID